MCDCFHLAFPNWHAASGTGAGRRLRGPETSAEDDSTCGEPPQVTEGERPRPQGSSPVEEYPETDKFDSDKECEVELDPHHKSKSGKKTKKPGLGSIFEKRSTPKMSKLKEIHSPESGVIVKTANDGCAEGLVYGGGGKEGIFIKEVVPESPASKSLKLKEGDQILSATVYFDNVSYEDAIQILEHAQAYKVKLCLKRKPDITETEPAIESDVIPEEELYTPEMREQGKTKRRGDARISWPKFPSFGKGRKSRFTRSHSSSEADEQRKLELSPTTSDTESPIKSQDALKGKKRHKIKLSALTKRGRISSSEDQDTDTPTTGQISGKILQTPDASDMLSPECLESPTRQTPEVYITENLKIVEDVRPDQKMTEPPSVQHKVELITIDSTLKTADLTMALADKESSPGIKSPDGKKKKKERSELKLKILGKDKSHKKDTKAKSSPKRLKTLGASIEIPDPPENKVSTVTTSVSQTKLQGEQQAKSVEISIPKVELDMSDVFICKSSEKGDVKMKKQKEMKEKQATAAFKLPKIGLSGIYNEETIQKINVNLEERTTKIVQRTTDSTEAKDDPYEQLSSRTQLPKREEIEIPGMEDLCRSTRAKGLKEPKTGFMGHNDAEAVQLSIDVDSVKEAVSKLPGYRLPKVDVSGVPIPEEITVIDANAQRISVKTPTKVVDTKTKHETHFTQFDVTASPKVSKITIKLPKLSASDITEEPLIEPKVDLSKTKPTESDRDIKTDVCKREDIIIPGKECTEEVTVVQAHGTEKTEETKSRKAKITPAGFGIAKPDIKIPDIGIDLPKQKGGIIKGERIIIIQEVKTSTTETRKGKMQTGKGMSDVKIPEIDSIEFIDSVGGQAQKDGSILLTGLSANLDVAKPSVEISIPKIRDEGVDAGELTAPRVQAPEINMPISEVKYPYIELKEPSAKVGIKSPEFKSAEIDVEGSPSKFKRPTFKLPRFGVTPNVTVEVSDKTNALKLPEAQFISPEEDIAHDIKSHKIDVEGPSLDIKTASELDVKGSKFKMPKFGISMAKIKGPEANLSLSRKDANATLPEAKAEVKLPDVEQKDTGIKAELKTPEIAVYKQDVEGSPSRFKMPSFKLPKFGTPNIAVKVHDVDKDIKIEGGDITAREKGLEVNTVAPSIDFDGTSTDMKTTESEQDGKGNRFKMPHLGFSMPKVKGPKMDLNLTKKDVEGKLPEPNADVEIEGGLDGQEERSKMSTFGLKMPKVKGPEFDLSLMTRKDTDVTLPEAKVDGKLPDADKVDVSLGKPVVVFPEAKAEVEKPELELKPLRTDAEGQRSKFKMPTFEMAMPKVTGPEFPLGFTKKDVDVTLPEARADINLPEVELKESQAKVKVKAPEIEVVDTDRAKLKMPSFNVSMPKLKGPDIHLGLSKKDTDTTLPDTQAEAKLQEGDVSVETEVFSPEEKVEVNLEGQGGKFKMPKIGLTKPKVKGPEIDLSVSKKDVTISESKVEIKLPESSKMDMKLPYCEAEIDGHGSKFKMPKFRIELPKTQGPEIDVSLMKKDVHAKLPEAKTEVRLPEASGVDINLEKVSLPITKMEVKEPALEIKPLQSEGELDGQGSKFKMPKFGMSMPKVKGPEIDLTLSKKDVDITLPKTKSDVSLPDVELKQSSAKVEMEASLQSVKESPSMFKMPTFKFPKFGGATPNVSMTVPDIDKEIKIDGAEMHISMPDTDVDLPEVKAVQLPVVELKEHSEGIVLEQPGEDSKIKKPKFSLPKFSFSKPSIKAPEVDVSLPETNVEMHGGKMDFKAPECEAEVDRQGRNVKMSKFGITIPNVTGPEIDISLPKKDVDMTLPEAKGEVKHPDVELKGPSVEVEIKAPEIKVATKSTKESPSKFKMPTFELPKFGVSTPSATVEVPGMDKDLKIDGGEIKSPEEVLKVDISAPSIDIEGPSTNIKSIGADHEGKGSKFKMPSLGFSVPQVKQPDLNLSFSKKDVEVTLPEAKGDIILPDVELKGPSAEMEIKAPEIKVATKSTKESPSKFKMPTFKLPKFGVSTPSATVEVPGMDKDLKIDGGEIKSPEEVLTVDISAPSIDIEGPSTNIKSIGADHEGKGSKFKMPSLGFSVSQVKQPDLNLSLSKKDVEVTLPEAKGDIILPDVELKGPSAEMEIKAPEIKVATKSTKESPSKFKMPTFKLPKFGVTSPSATVEVPGMDKDLKIDGEIRSPEEILTVDIAAPTIDAEGPSIHMKSIGADHEGKGSKFKMPSLGFSVSQVKQPDMDLSLVKKDIEVTLPEAKGDITLPDVELKGPSAEMEIKAPEIKVATKSTKESPSKFKMPTFKLPKFGVTTPSATVEVPGIDKDLKIVGGEIKSPEEVLTIDIEAPSIDTEGPSINMKTIGSDHEGKGSKFKMPSLGFSVSQVKQPDMNLSLSKKDVEVTLPEAKGDITLPDVELKGPSAEVEIKAPEIKVATKSTKESPSKFKMPTFKLPKFGVTSPSATIEVPGMDKDLKIDGEIRSPEEILTVDIAAPRIDAEGPSIHMKSIGADHEGKGSKFKMPSLGFSVSQVKQPDMDLSLAKKEIQVTLPEAKGDITLPDVELKGPSAEVEIKAPESKVATKSTKESPSKFKMPTFKLPKFGVTTPSATVEVPGMDKDLKIDGEIRSPEEVLTVDIAAPRIDAEGPSIHMKSIGADHEGKGSKFKMPSLGFSVSQVKQPDMDLSLVKKDIEVTLPEAKGDITLPDVELKGPSAEVEIKAPEIKVATKSTKESPSKFKMPTFKLPKFGVSTPSASVEMPHIDKDINIDGGEIKSPDEVLKVDIAAPSVDVPTKEAKVDVTVPDIDTDGLSVDVKTKGSGGSKFKLPSFGISMPKVKGPDIDISSSKTDVDVTLPEDKVELELPNVKVKEPEGAISVPDAPTVEVEAEIKRPHWTFPRFSFSRTSVTAPDIDVNLETPKFTSPEAQVEVPLPDVELQGRSGAISMEEPPAAELDANLKKSKFSLPRFSFSKSGVKQPEVNAELPCVDISIPEGEVKVKQSHVEFKPPEGVVELDVQGGKFKMPKFGISIPKVKGPEIDLSTSKTNVIVPEAKAEVELPDVKINEPSAKMEIKTHGIEAQTGIVEGSPSKLKMPTFTLPKFGAATPKISTEIPEIETEAVKLEVSKKGATVDFSAPSIDTDGLSIDMKAKGGESEGSGSKFKIPKFGLSMPNVKGPDKDLSISNKDANVTLPAAKAEVQLPDVKIKQQTANVEVKALEIEVRPGNMEGSPSKLKMPKFTLPKFGASTPKVSVEVPDVDKDFKIDGATLEAPKMEADTEGLSVEVKDKGNEREGSKSKFKLPSFGISIPKVKGPDIDISLSKTDVDVTIPEVKAEIKPSVKVKETEGAFSVPDAPTVEVEADVKRPNWTFPRFSFSKASGKTPDIDVDFEIPKGDVTSPEAKAEVPLPDVELQGRSGAISMEEPPAAELDSNLKKSKFSLPRFSFSKSGVKEPEVNAELPRFDTSLPGGEVKIKQSDVELKPPEGDVELDVQGGKFKLPKFGISIPKVKGPEIDLSTSKANVIVPEAKAEVELPDVKINEPSAKLEIKTHGVEAQTGIVEGLPSKFKMPTFTLPKFGAATPKVSTEIPDVDPQIETEAVKLEVSKKGATVDFSAPSIDTDGLSIGMKAKGGESEGSGSKFKIPKFGLSMPNVKGPDKDLSISNKDANVTLPAAKAEVQLPDVKIKQQTANVEVKAPEIEVRTGNMEGSPSKLKMPTFTLPKFGASTPKVSVEVPDVDKDFKIDGATLEAPKMGADTEGLSVKVKDKGNEAEGSGGKFKLPSFGISIPKVKGPEIDMSLSKTDVDVTIPEVKAEIKPSVKVKETEGAFSVPDAPTVEVEADVKRPNWTFPRFSFSKASGKTPDVDVDFEIPKGDVTSPEAKAEVPLPDVELQGRTGAISMEEPPAVELDSNLKKSKFSLPRFSFSKSSVKEPEVSTELPRVEISLTEGEVKVKEPEMEIKIPELEVEHSRQESRFKLPTFGISLPRGKVPEDLSTSQKHTDISLPEVKAEAKLESELPKTEAKSKDFGGSPLKFKMPTVKMPKFGGVTYDVTVEAPDADKEAETTGPKLKEDVTVEIKGPKVDIETEPKAAVRDTETQNTETDGTVDLASPSKFKLPSFKMPRLSFSRPKPDDEYAPVETIQHKDAKSEMEVEQKWESKSPKMSLTSFGEILKNIDVEFDVSKQDKEEEIHETLKEAHETDSPNEQPKEKETKTKQDATKSPERTGWFKFPSFGLSSPSEPAKISEKDEHKDEHSPVGETADDELSPTCSVQSSDAFADISSAMTSEHIGMSLSSPTKVTVKFNDPETASGLEEMHSSTITTTRTELISVEPNLPEKITILSSGVSSSSEDTLRLESGKIHVITSNIQATPEAQHAKLLTAVQIQSAGAPPLESEANEAASRTFEDSPSEKRTVFERRFISETSSEINESKETIVITKQITRIGVFDSSEPISGETATSIQRLRDSVHSEKMRFFDGAEK